MRNALISILRQPAQKERPRETARALLGAAHISAVARSIEAKITEDTPFEETVSRTIEDIHTLLQIDESVGKELLTKLHSVVNLYETFNAHFHSELTQYDSAQESFDPNARMVGFDPYAANITRAMLEIIKRYPASYGFEWFSRRQGFLHDVERIAGVEYGKLELLEDAMHGDPNTIEFDDYLAVAVRYKTALTFLNTEESLARWEDFVATAASITDMWRNVHHYLAKINNDLPRQAEAILKLIDIDPVRFVGTMFRDPVTPFVRDFYTDIMTTKRENILSEGPDVLPIALAAEKIHTLLHENGLWRDSSDFAKSLPKQLTF